MNIAGSLARSASRYPAQPAVSQGVGIVCDYRRLGAQVRSLAGNLRDRLRLRVGDRVGVVMPNGPEYPEILFAIWHAGLCAVPMNARLHPQEIAYILDSAEASVCFVSAETEAAVASLAGQVPCLREVIPVGTAQYANLIAGDGIDVAEVAPGDPAWLFYTSGTTGRPKGATLSHRNLWMMVLSHYADIRSMRCTDTMIHAAPLSHGCGLWSIASIGRAANNVVLESASYDPDEICRLIAVWPDISMYHAPTMLKRLVNSPMIHATDTANLRTLIYGGSHMYLADLQQSLTVLGGKLVQIYGQGESPNTITVLGQDEHIRTDGPDHLARLNSAGVARTGVEIRIGDPDDRALPAGELGEVLVRGDIVMSGYWRKPEDSARTLRNGWLHTGDIGVLDAEGFLTLKDRSKDIIISGGSNIYPREVEEVLLRHPSVLEVSVLGRPHPDWGEEVVAVVVPRAGQQVTEDNLDALCLDNIARYKRPRAYRFIDQLPKNNYGKILKSTLRDVLGREPP